MHKHVGAYTIFAEHPYIALLSYTVETLFSTVNEHWAYCYVQHVQSYTLGPVQQNEHKLKQKHMNNMRPLGHI